MVRNYFGLAFAHRAIDTAPYLYHNVGKMRRPPFVADLEQLVLASVSSLGDDAYGLTIHDQVEALTASYRIVSLGSIYTTLDRLERKGYVRSWYGGRTEARGGRSKRYFELTAEGSAAFENSLAVATRLVRLREQEA